MKKAVIILFSFVALVSCQKNLIMRHADGELSVNVESSPIVEVITKAGETVPVNDFNVYVSSETSTFSYIYKDMPAVITVPTGTYVVSADNVTEQEALSQPNVWGQVRYYGESEPKLVKAGGAPTEYNLVCRMANTAVSVVFGENIDTHFTGYKVKLYTTETRKLEFDAANTAGENPAVAYFSPVTLNYEFTGTYMDDETPMTLKGTKALTAATHLHLTFRISTQNGIVSKPVIEVDDTCEDLYETVTVDPTDPDSAVIE